MLKRLAALSSLLLATASCGDDSNPNRPDGRPEADADLTDAEMPDAEPAVTTHAGTVSILDVRVETTTGAVDGALGSGGQVVASLGPTAGTNGVVDTALNEIYDDRSAIGAGCVAFVWDLATDTLPTDEDHGPITITGTTATIPACNYLGGDYVCLAGMGQLAAGDSMVNDAGGAGTQGMIVAAGAFTDADIGRYVKVSGATNIRNNGVFPIVGRSGATTLVYANTAAVTEAVSTQTVTYTIIAGAGPVPVGTEFVADDNSVTVALDAPTDDEFEDFTTTATAAGDNFSLTPESTTLITMTPVDGSAMTLACDDEVTSVTAGAFGGVTGGNVTITATGIGTGVRVGAEVTIANAISAGNNGTFTITAVPSANEITYANASAVAEGFDDDPITTAEVSDCGTAGVTAVNIDFSNARLEAPLFSYTGADPAFDNPVGADNCAIVQTGGFPEGIFSAAATTRIRITGATTAAHNGTFQITAASTDSITYATTAGCTDAEAFLAGTMIEIFDDISGAASEYRMPDPATAGATLVGQIRCAALLAGTVTIPAGASAAIDMVDPLRVRTVFLRGGLAQQTNADGTNPINVITGHAVVGFSTTPD